MYTGTVAADSMTQAQNQSTPDFIATTGTDQPTFLL
jgi:hypothetical protein